MTVKSTGTLQEFCTVTLLCAAAPLSRASARAAASRPAWQLCSNGVIGGTLGSARSAVARRGSAPSPRRQHRQGPWQSGGGGATSTAERKAPHSDQIAKELFTNGLGPEPTCCKRLAASDMVKWVRGFPCTRISVAASPGRLTAVRIRQRSSATRWGCPTRCCAPRSTGATLQKRRRSGP